MSSRPIKNFRVRWSKVMFIVEGHEAGDLVISPLTADDVPTEATTLKAELTEMLPFAPIVSLLIAGR
ncbi:hypothetical protein LWC34_54345 [Kibdelosporangium philippinense]|uniref:Uncharacterized protein n=1 Tax=Kibdelosporangium philippinense TaxID=211113 RepID=A0ABS8ZX90_9PSEU|nr:hypothetical protein [Kibdelosporangium philippinense]MCE7011740.1 hypothetical protein [Kibdelosporangium philippinense]